MEHFGDFDPLCGSFGGEGGGSDDHSQGIVDHFHFQHPHHSNQQPHQQPQLGLGVPGGQLLQSPENSMVFL